MSFSRLEMPVQFLKGVGPRRAEALGRMGILTARDLLYHVPRRYDDASTVHPIARLEVGMDATLMGRVRSSGVIPTRSGLRIFQAVLQDHSGMITCAWPGQQWLDRKIREGDVLLVTGPVKFFHGRQVQPREFTLLGRGSEGTELPAEDDAGTVFVTYPASEHVPQWVLRRIFERNLDTLLPQAAEDEYLPDERREALGLPTLPEALRRLHRPESPSDAEAGRRRLAFDELFFLQLVQAQVRWRQTLARPGIVFQRTNALVRPLHEALPFQLTEAQARALREIYADMTSERRMNRLLQGDVGSGKTVVALFAMLLAVESGWQAALMAPTEILAEQHAENLRGMLQEVRDDGGGPADGAGGTGGPGEAAPEGAAVAPEVALLTGRMGAAERRDVLGRLASGEAGIVVGTHALIQEGVEFHRLGLVVVDEQHRFGVKQRMALTERASATDGGAEAEQGTVFGAGGPAERSRDPDVLIMSATPIPRSLAMTVYGDLDISVLDELPPGRQPVRTTLRYPGKRADVHAFIDQEVAAGRQAYVVYPLVEESEKVDLRSAVEEHERLRDEVFPIRRVGLVHGQLPPAEKDDVMRAFRRGEIDVLVATTVIEVGIDVPNATVMVIEHAERFGLSQLHQLRGRVGRGAAESHCVLIAEPGEAAAERLKIFCRTTDGFEIARADLRIRGQGDLFGTQQHGRDPVLRFADLTRDEGVLIHAQALAREVVAADPHLEAPEHAAVSELLETRYADRVKLFATG